MRIKFVAAAAVFLPLAACGGAKTSQANNAQANVSNESRPAETANASATNNGMVMLAVRGVTGAEALRVMHDRHEGMEAIGDANKAIRRSLAGPDLPTLRANAAKIAQLSRQASGWFPPGTGPDVGKTGAKPEIWQNPQDFAAKLHQFQLAAQAFNAAASSKDVGAINAKFAELGQACKACHDKYRAEMHH
jgi:cytochrome c556